MSRARKKEKSESPTGIEPMTSQHRYENSWSRRFRTPLEFPKEIILKPRNARELSKNAFFPIQFVRPLVLQAN